MKKFKNILIISISTLLVVLFLYVYLYGSNNTITLKSEHINVNKDKAIAIMISNEEGTGYYESDSDSFPTGMLLNTTLSTCENGGTISYDGTDVKIRIKRSDKCYVYFDRVIRHNLATYLIDTLYSYDGDGSNLYYHDKTGNNGSYTGAEYEDGDLSYRYSGPTASVENYVCFASDEETCPSENLYRIIGIFKDTNNEYQVKLIKASRAQATVSGATMLGTNGAYESSTAYKWHTVNGVNTWSQSELNTINLNTNYVGYLNAINSKWINMIETHTWKVAGNTSTYIRSTAGVNNVYYREITSPSANTTYSDEIGLMYVSDYMYGASPTHWSKMGYNDTASLSYSSAKNDDWLALGINEWTITRLSESSYSAFFVNSSGYVDYISVNNGWYGVRPVFYLKSDVMYESGTGTSDDPYRIYG